MKTIEFPFYDDPKQQIESDFQPDAVKELSELAAAFTDDYPTQKLFLKASPESSAYRDGI